MAIQFRKVTYTYQAGTSLAHTALDDIDLTFRIGKMTAVIGATGSGKSTMVQHLNALLLPTKGEVEVLDKIIKADEKPKNLKSLRQKVGYVFQFPEYQLFEETVLKDASFGPKNFGASDEEAVRLASNALKKVGIDPSLFSRSPLELSGGQKRRVAIAGILAMEPDLLVLDEPTAGLDPMGTKNMMELFHQYNKEGHTVILVTHNMDQVFEYCDDVVVLSHGKVEAHTDAQDFFDQRELMAKAQIDAPNIVAIQQMLKDKGMPLGKTAMSVSELADKIAEVLRHE